MGVDLIRNNEEMGFNWSGWRKILEIAFNHGWKPTGTVNDIDQDGKPIQDWSGTYFSNDYQYVTDEDAKNLAEALERAISEFDEELYMKKVLPFIEFCKKGGFHIF